MVDELVSLEADVLRIGFKLGFFGKPDIARWADRQIAAIDEPSPELIDLSMNQRVDPHDLLKLLEAFGQTDSRQRVETEIGFLGLLLSSQRITVERAIRALWSLVHAPGITDEQQSQIAYLDDGYDFALAGTYATMSEIEAELRAFVTPYADQLVRNHPQLFVT